MNAPIAEIPPPAPRRAPKKPPRSLSVAVIIGLILGALSLIFYTPQIPEISASGERALMAVLITVFYVIPMFLLWRGLNWARWLMIGLCVLGIVYAISEPFIPADPSDVPTSSTENFINVFWPAYEVALIILLLTPRMRQHFAGKPTEALNE